MVTSATTRAGGSPARPASARLFIALWPDDPVRDAMRQWRLPEPDRIPSRSAARPTPIERLHLTLHFLGNLPRDRAPGLLDGLGVPFRPFELFLRRLERWRGGLVVAPVDEAPQELHDLQGRLGDALRTLQLTVDDRAFRPHITLARGHPGPWTELPLPPLRWPVRRYALVESRHATGEDYVLLKSWPSQTTDSPAAQ